MLAAACSKSGEKPAPTTAGSSGSSGSAAVAVVPEGPVDTTPLASVDLGKLDDTKQHLFYKLIGSLSSPCGKAQSLRASFTTDTACKRAPFAVRYVISLLADEASEPVAREQYDLKYKPADKVKLDVSKAPHVGPDDAPVRLVEFFDYGCPHCAEFKSILGDVESNEGNKLVVYYMNFVLGHFPNSKEAAQGAIAANGQHKFAEMHDVLFTHRNEHTHDQVFDDAKGLGLDMVKFAADYDTAAPQVDADHAQGDAAGVDSTPTLYFNDRKYTGPMAARYIEMWIDEEFAVNQ